MTGRAAAAGRSLPWLVAAGVLGTLHALPSFMWAAGSDFLLHTVGDIATQFEGRRWLLWPVGLVKLGFAWFPLGAAQLGWPPATRAISWLGAAALIIWGAGSAVVALLALGGVLGEADDIASLQGHAFLWDPLFVAWGLALAVGLARRRGVSGT